MTGIERLRQMAEDFKSVKTAEHCTFIVNTWRGRYIDDAIADIADQIAREQADRSDEIAESFRSEVSEAYEWVRERGGLDAVRSEWRSRVPYDKHERGRQRLLDHIAECETALRRRNGRIEELGRRVSDLTTENAEMRKRAMPEGIEWPRYESGEPVMFGGFAADVFGTALDEPIFSVELFENGFTLHGDGVQAFYGYEERVKRPAVPAGDGEPLEAGQTVWDVDGHGPLVVKALPSKGDQLVVLDNGGTNFYRYPEKLTHERPESKCRDCAHWQKDPTADNMGVCWFYYHEHEGQDCYAARRGDIGVCEEFMPRGKALAERDR